LLEPKVYLIRIAIAVLLAAPFWKQILAFWRELPSRLGGRTKGVELSRLERIRLYQARSVGAFGVGFAVMVVAAVAYWVIALPLLGWVIVVVGVGCIVALAGYMALMAVEGFLEGWGSRDS
jgi:hypothetical protein